MALKNKMHLINKHRTILFFAFLIALMYTFSVVMQVLNGEGSDTIIHAKYAEGIPSGGQMPPHFLYHIILICMHALLNVSFLHASFISVFTFVFITFISAYKNIDKSSVDLNKNFILLGTCFLLLSHPIAILFPYDKHLYFGYMVSTVYHNPTILLLKIFSLLHFVLLCDLLVYEKEQRSLYCNILLLGLLTALTIIAKPVYIIALLPALFFLFIFNKLTGRISSRFLGVVSAVAIPGFIILLWQYKFFYGSGNQNSIGISIFEIFTRFSKLWTLIPKLIASIAFPISVVISMGSQLTSKLDFQLSSLMFAVSLIYAYFLFDTVGGDIKMGNFWWSAQIAHFLFLFVCIKSYINFMFRASLKHVTKLTKLSYIPIIVGAIQFISGLVWYVVNTDPAFKQAILW